MKWLRVDSNWRHSPKAIIAGFWGRAVIQAAWEMAKEFETGGNVAKFWDARVITGWLGAPEYAAEISEGLIACERAELVVVEENLPVIANWWQHQMPSTDRVRAYRNDLKRDETHGNDLKRSETQETQDIDNDNDNDIDKKKETSALPTFAFLLSDRLRAGIVKAKPDHVLGRIAWDGSRKRAGWAKDFRALVEIDGVDESRISNVIDWVCGDPFWGPNIQSGRKLREQFDRLESTMRAAGWRERNREQESRIAADQARKKREGSGQRMSQENFDPEANRANAAGILEMLKERVGQ